MNILITGAFGFLGKELQESLTKEGHHIFTLGRNAKCDIVCDLATTKVHLLPNVDIDIVVHAAGKAHSLPRTAADEAEFYEVNFTGTQNLCLAIDELKHKPFGFVFISTVAVYGVTSGENISEAHPLNGTGAYAKSKIMAEKWLHEWAQKAGIALGILRLPLIAGPYAPGNLGAMINGIKNGKYLSIGNADARKSIVWVKDIAGIVTPIAKVGGTFNITDGYHPSFKELELSVASALGLKKPLKIPLLIAKLLGYVGNVIGDRFPLNSDKLEKITSTLTFDDTKARSVLNWNPSQVLTKIPEIV